MRRLNALAGLALALASFPGLAQESPRAYVDGVAHAIEQGYFDEKQARQVATTLRDAAAKGEFDALTDKRELASALTIKLQPFDKHFRVDWTDAALAPAGEGPVVERAPSPDRHRRGNYGVRRAEVLPGNVGLLDLRGDTGQRIRLGSQGGNARQQHARTQQPANEAHRAHAFSTLAKTMGGETNCSSRVRPSTATWVV